MLLSMMSPKGVIRALTTGVMRVQGQALSSEDKMHVAQFLTRRPFEDAPDQLSPPSCAANEPKFDFEQPPEFSGWGLTPENTHEVSDAVAGLDRSNLSKLHLKWAVGFSGAIRIRSQPGVGGGSLFIGTQDGVIHALNLESGCERWHFQADSEIRTAIIVAPWKKGDRAARPLLYFTDETNIYAIDAVKGKEVWRKKPDNHPKALLSAAPVLYQDKLIVGVSSVEEMGSSLKYECCTFRGAVVAYSALDGQEIWRSFMVDPPKVQGKNSAGTNKWAPAGAAVWSAPAIDAARNQLYVGTGDNYARPSTGTSDSIVAIDLKNGKIKWVFQATKDDVWNTGCLWGQRELCPEPEGPDFDFAAAPVLARTAAGKEVVVGAQKSGFAYGIDPDNGHLIWSTQVGHGGATGGVEFGLAIRSGAVFVGVVDFDNGRKVEGLRPGLYALDLATGSFLWKRPDSWETCRGRTLCVPGVYAALTVTSEFVIAGNTDGWLRIHDLSTGEVLWHYDMTQTVKTVGGGEAAGGSMGGPTAAVPIGGKLIVPSGYGMVQYTPGNVVLVFDTK